MVKVTHINNLYSYGDHVTITRNDYNDNKKYSNMNQLFDNMNNIKPSVSKKTTINMFNINDNNTINHKMPSVNNLRIKRNAIDLIYDDKYKNNETTTKSSYSVINTTIKPIRKIKKLIARRLLNSNKNDNQNVDTNNSNNVTVIQNRENRQYDVNDYNKDSLSELPIRRKKILVARRKRPVQNNSSIETTTTQTLAITAETTVATEATITTTTDIINFTTPTNVITTSETVVEMPKQITKAIQATIIAAVIQQPLPIEITIKATTEKSKHSKKRRQRYQNLKSRKNFEVHNKNYNQSITISSLQSKNDVREVKSKSKENQRLTITTPVTSETTRTIKQKRRRPSKKRNRITTQKPSEKSEKTIEEEQTKNYDSNILLQDLSTTQTVTAAATQLLSTSMNEEDFTTKVIPSSSLEPTFAGTEISAISVTATPSITVIKTKLIELNTSLYTVTRQRTYTYVVDRVHDNEHLIQSSTLIRDQILTLTQTLTKTNEVLLTLPISALISSNTITTTSTIIATDTIFSTTPAPAFTFVETTVTGDVT